MKILIGLVGLLIIVSFAFVDSKTNVNRTSEYYDSLQTKADTLKSEKQVEDIGIGPIKEMEFGPLDEKLAKQGRNLFDSKCVACHKLDTKLVGPPLRNITKVNAPIYIMNYLLNTTDMQKKDPKLKKLIKQYNGVVMPDQSLSQKQARALVEYFRSTEK